MTAYTAMFPVTVWMLASGFVGFSSVFRSVCDGLPVRPIVNGDSTIRVESKWLDDFDTEPRKENDDEKMQADSPAIVGGVNRHQFTSSVDDDDLPRCPSLLRASISAARLCPSVSAECQADADCSPTGRKCCFDGCRRTCLVAVQPPPYIDWKRQPQTRLTSGRSWLIQGSEEEKEVEWCSTSYDYSDPTDSEPLLCPHGYICHIEEPGDEEDGEPNRGRCIREDGDITDDKTAFKMSASPASGGVCRVSEKVYNNGQTFTYGRHTCKCEDSSVLCHVGKKLILRPTSSALLTSKLATPAKRRG